MPLKTISKLPRFVIFASMLCMAVWSCGDASSIDQTRPEFDSASSGYDKPRILAKIESDEIKESSGLAVSKCQDDVFWTHNDSGDGAFIYAFDSGGRNLGTWSVQSASNTDWEDIAAFKDASGQCFLYIGETGNTDKNERSEHKIFRVREPKISSEHANTNRKNARQTENVDVLAFRYPDGRHDAETLLVHPTTGDMYILTKHRSKPSGVYKLKGDFRSTTAVRAERLGDVTVPAVPNGFLTGGGISPDGTRVVICDYTTAFEFTLPEGAANFDAIWSQKPVRIDLGERKQGEAVDYGVDGLSIFATSEKKNPPLIEVKRRNP